MKKYEPAPLPLPFTKDLKLDDQGEEVYILICALMGLGFTKKISEVGDVFTEKIDIAVKLAQERFGIKTDGVVGKTTKFYLENALKKARIPNVSAPTAKQFKGSEFAKYCEDILCNNIPWTPDIPFIQPFVNTLGKQRWAWCGATVYWLINEFLFKPNEKTMSLNYTGMEATFALVEAFQQFFQSKKWYKDNTSSYEPPPGAIVMFDWDQININEPDLDYEDHIGVFLRKEGDLFICGEGNTDHNIIKVGRTAIKKRERDFIQGFGIIPENTEPW